VPAGKAERFEWLKNWRSKSMLAWKDTAKDLLVQRYGSERAAKVQFVESFELCEYGRQPSREELSKLFPK